MAERPKKIMTSTMAATDARIHFGEVLKRVHTNREHVTVEKDGLAIATIISQADYEEFRRFMALRQFEELSEAVAREAEAQGYTEEQFLKDFPKIKKDVYQQRYGRSSQSRRKKTA